MLTEARANSRQKKKPTIFLAGDSVSPALACYLDYYSSGISQNNWKTQGAAEWPEFQ